jgi:hypothetical protein
MLVLKVNRAFSAGAFWGAMNPGALPQARGEILPRLWRSTHTGASSRLPTAVPRSALRLRPRL